MTIGRDEVSIKLENLTKDIKLIKQRIAEDQAYLVKAEGAIEVLTQLLASEETDNETFTDNSGTEE